MKKASLLFTAVLLLSLQACVETVVEEEPYPDSFEVVKQYRSEDVKACKNLAIECARGLVVFFDDKGCGCTGPKDLDLRKREEESITCGGSYAPVCGKLVPACEEEPCESFPQTFGNRCFAEQAGAKDIKDGACEDKGVNGDDII